jgi:FKBP-type peptidyl-prolyl cis-trans isomerase FkpA
MLRQLLPIALLGSLIACGGSSTTPTPLNIPFSTTDLIVGTGTTVAVGTTVQITYIGYLYSTSAADHKGTNFASSSVSGPLVFKVGQGQVIPGMDQGVTGMKVGGRREIIIPPDLAYGAAGNGPVPPNATLLFDVDLVNAQ